MRSVNGYSQEFLKRYQVCRFGLLSTTVYVVVEYFHAEHRSSVFLALYPRVSVPGDSMGVSRTTSSCDADTAVTPATRGAGGAFRVTMPKGPMPSPTLLPPRYPPSSAPAIVVGPYPAAFRAETRVTYVVPGSKPAMSRSKEGETPRRTSVTDSLALGPTIGSAAEELPSRCIGSRFPIWVSKVTVHVKPWENPVGDVPRTTVTSPTVGSCSRRTFGSGKRRNG